MSVNQPQRPTTRHGGTLALLQVLLVVSVGLGSAGCTQNPYMAAPTAWQNPQQPAVNPLDSQITELQRRVQLLDDNNRQLHTQIAQAEQQTQVYRDELSLVRQQLAESTSQLEQTRLAASQAEQQVRGMQASTKFRGGASIQANTNLQAMAQGLQLGGLAILPEGNTLRIVLPADQLFQSNTANPQPQAAAIIDPVAGAIRSHFPRQRIGIEGHSDGSPLYGGQFNSPHQLTAAQSVAVLEIMTTRGKLPAPQVFTKAMGAANPRYDNTTAAGRAANRRVEIIIYPETF
ncbi:putative lipoprotein YiaD precursor [Roseimaritima multifibrata]|uniref:Putative lipoprotein YiaD n=1 Tax=Roseimaritima multifibrata TaxID=1930274 RepID=A0A517MJ56_9BACT|nr:OmpA family protein [Roseimaritima multifibrata]QDS94922.1 putative lipoprotein YiaD precursor [Roseimaritima multifibrata]